MSCYESAQIEETSTPPMMKKTETAGYFAVDE
jgi:hypothetical protein